MNKVFGMLFMGVLMSALVRTDVAWAGNWNSTKQGVGQNGICKDKDCSNGFYDSYGPTSEENVNWYTKNGIRLFRFILKEKQIGSWPIDNKRHFSAPSWARADRVARLQTVIRFHFILFGLPAGGSA